MNSAEQIFQFLNKVSRLSFQSWSSMVAYAMEIQLKKDDYFVKEGEVSKEIGFLTKGIVRSYYISKEGKEYNKTLFAAPNIIGSYVSIITGQPNRLPQQALTDCTITKIPMSVIENLSKEQIEIERLRRKIAEMFFVLKEKRELEMALLQAEERYLIFREEYPGVEQLIPQYHIASYLGISATQLSRIRKKMSLQS
ncbi:Crp/Fnr family transcriptional regulator [Aureispira anguillae]|uniref:Crp/Fnr family transcriptional regulator n=2 Tax=Aureispira anguillae TaxID=2864201 RepID=A0A916DSZ3_9BACT|nr:Crp/Fnr family transcriptional regulator [Aureispira anguillae]